MEAFPDHLKSSCIPSIGYETQRGIVAVILSYLCPHKSEMVLDYLCDVFAGRSIPSYYDLGFMIGGPLAHQRLAMEDEDEDSEE